MQLSRHFARVELQCPDCHRCDLAPDFIEALEALRVDYGKPMVINSGYRCNNRNKQVGGAKDSQHLYGNAADVRIPKYDRYRFIQLAMKHGFTGIGIADTFIHIDRRHTTPVVWTY